MRKARMTQEERINARVTAMRAHRKSVQRKKAIPAIVTAVCAMAFLAGGTAFGISMINNSKPQTVQSSSAAKNAQSAQNTAKVKNVQTAQNTSSVQNNMPTYDESTNSYSYSFTGCENNEYINDENTVWSDNSHSEISGMKGSDYVHENSGSSAQPAYTGTHHSGASWNGTGSPLHFTESGKTSKGYDWRYEGGNGLVDLGCDYTFDGNSYDFSLIGKEPGSGSITVWHNTDNNTQVPTTINFTVDDNLNVSYN